MARLPLAPLIALLSFAAIAQAPQFRSGVQLLTIEATVRDKAGAPVADLKPSDFTVTIDGKPRTVLFAQFFHSEPGPLVAAGDSTVGRYLTNTESPAGHVVVFAVDRNALPPGTERPILRSAAAMLNQLSPGDSIGLAEIPGRAFDVTRDHRRIEEILNSITGMPPPRTSPRNVTFEEAKAFERHDLRVIREVYERECTQQGPYSGDSQFCPPEVQTRAREVLAIERAHAQMLLAALTSIVAQLEVVRAPKHVVLISAGLPFDVEFLDRFKAFEHAAAEARVTVDTIRVHEFVADASTDARAGASFEDPMVKSGMDTLATMTGGRAFAPAGTGAGTFARIASDVMSFYQLGIETVPADSNGKLHDVKIHVNRSNVDTVARPSIVVPAGTPASGLLDSALKQPIDAGGVPIAAATYSMFARSGAPRVVVAAEIGAAASSSPAEWGAVVLHEGKAAASTHGRIPVGPERPQSVMTTMELPAGSYRLRVAAVDADGETGTLEIPFTAGAHDAAAGARLSDLMVGVTSGNQLTPKSRVADTDDISAIVQTADGGRADLTGVLQVVRGGTTTAAATTPLVAAETAGGLLDPVTLQGTLAAGTLSPGRYTAIAIIRADDQVLGHVSRVVEVIPGAAPMASPSVASVVTARPAVPLITDAPAADIMKRVAAYVERYGEEASVLVGVERYSQSANVASGPTIQTRAGRTRAGESTNTPVPTSRTVRSLTSEIALVRNTAAVGGWLAFRDVVEVDKKPVADRGDRLRVIFAEKAPDVEAAKKINSENARFNLGRIRRTFNVPTATLFFFTPANLRRFEFKARGTEPLGGVDTLVVDFHETGKPTLVMNSAGTDVPSSGTLWIDPADGHVLKTQLVLTGYAGVGSSAIVDVTYRLHADFDMWVPASMHEAYVTQADTVTGDAQYAEFRRFQTTARIK